MQSTPIASFGRRRGRRLKANRSALVESLLPQLLITLPEFSSPLRGEVVAQATGGGDTSENTPSLILPPQGGGNLGWDNGNPLWLELGFGGGEHLVEQARRHPELRFIGCEPYVNGMATLLVGIEKLNLKNIRLFNGDGRLVLERLPDDSIERLFILFPDPWPKVRHYKRRLISQATLALIYQKLKPGGFLRLATDHEDYCTWMLEQLLAFGSLKWMAEQASDWTTPPTDWVRTRYQTKAEAEGRKTTFLDWVRPSISLPS